MTTKEAQVLLLKGIIQNRKLSAADIVHLQILINELEKQIEEKANTDKSVVEALSKIDPKHFDEPVEVVKENREVLPKYVSGMSHSWNLNIFTGPKLYLECGKCGAGFKYRMPLKSYPKVACDNCGVVNKVPLEYG